MGRGVAAALATVILMAACAGQGTDRGASGSGPLASGGDELLATIASYELVSGGPQRLIVRFQTTANDSCPSARSGCASATSAPEKRWATPSRAPGQRAGFLPHSRDPHR